jgi:hypothetical protein
MVINRMEGKQNKVCINWRQNGLFKGKIRSVTEMLKILRKYEI